ncbi:hypothetical protein NKI74_31695, partial [Mesorhizobium sp. M0494]|uniref:hypothetical protein n=1 Tax=Mesorhizobium sp. M0494 TaxID=2956951 RepID=UPI003339F448
TFRKRIWLEFAEIGALTRQVRAKRDDLSVVARLSLSFVSLAPSRHGPSQRHRERPNWQNGAAENQALHPFGDRAIPFLWSFEKPPPERLRTISDTEQNRPKPHCRIASFGIAAPPGQKAF